jgi:hypothetical protein
MLAASLKLDQFAGYPPEARSLVSAHLAALQQLPLSFLPSLLREIIDYDYKFPAERNAVDRELAHLSSLSPAEFDQWFGPFAQLSLSPRLESFDWINQPAQFLEQQSAHLWSTHQLDAFRKAATEYGDRLQAAVPAEKPAIQRLGIAIIGQGVPSYDAPLFRNLRKHGTCFGQVKPGDGLALILAATAARAKAHPVPYGHWYVDGGRAADHDAVLTSVSYQALEPMRAALLKTMQKDIARPGMGPEELRTHLARMTPFDLGIEVAKDPVLDRFQLKLLTEGSGTQIFSTTFAQWTTRETLRRAQALTLVVRFAPRQRQRPMNEMLANVHSDAEVDPVGSLVDGDMGAYYHWLNQQRLPGSERSAFLVWFEGHNQALAIAPSLPRNTRSDSAMDLGQLMSLVIS